MLHMQNKAESHPRRKNRFRVRSLNKTEGKNCLVVHALHVRKDQACKAKLSPQTKKTPAQGGRKVIEAGFIQARNLSSSEIFIRKSSQPSKLKV